ncbi:winged helix-turn-helix domain-containing protein [Streptomyces sp. RKAG293]|uniref:GntR family transcriptional regulator n=1 Tax=Streptomyces sp. RKAG293 TaxID=2893403 RepID=UPI0020348E57|nr:winged helix-turn-helix domain-containing protein [Streptomyces sp. RKAG293]MCM2418998.1 winged helix-turn-helix domain-containing protein [Streptomyces sp. RKAG293]
MDAKPEKKPNAKEIAATFRNDIADGVYGPGARLPGAKGYAGKLGVALMTVQNAYGRLAEEGLVEGRQGSGTYVVDPAAGEPTAQQAASSIRELQAELTHVTSQLSELRSRVEALEGGGSVNPAGPAV